MPHYFGTSTTSFRWYACNRGLDRLQRQLLSIGLLVCALCVSHRSFAEDTPTEFPLAQLSAGIHLIRAEVAADFRQREKGLMFRDRMGANQGMVFLFDTPGSQCMWMKNTLIPLSVAFLDADATILNIEDMKPQTETNHCAVKPALYALEMNLGWFAKHGLKPGARISGLPKLQ